MGLRGIENGVTRFHQVRVPAANRIGPEGAGLKIALTTLNTGRLSLPAMCVGAGKWCLKIAREWSAAREQWGKPVAQHEAVGAKISFIAATTFALEAVVDLSSQMADEDRNDIRIEAALAKLYGSRDGLADGRRAGPDPRRPRLRDRRLARRPRRAGRPRRADAARSAHQPDLRGLDRDHAPADRPGGGRRPPVGRGRPHRPGQVPVRQGAGPARRPAASTPAGCRSWSPAPASSRAPTPSSTRPATATSPRTCGTSSARARKLARSTFYAMSRWQGRMETKQGFLGRIVDIGAELFAMSAACVRAEHAAQPAATTAARRTSSPTSSAGRPGSAPRSSSAGSGPTPTTSTARWSTACCPARTTWLEEGIIDPSGEGPWIADATPGPSRRRPNVHRPDPLTASGRAGGPSAAPPTARRHGGLIRGPRAGPGLRAPRSTGTQWGDDRIPWPTRTSAPRHRRRSGRRPAGTSSSSAPPDRSAPRPSTWCCATPTASGSPRCPPPAAGSRCSPSRRSSCGCAPWPSPREDAVPALREALAARYGAGRAAARDPGRARRGHRARRLRLPHRAQRHHRLHRPRARRWPRSRRAGRWPWPTRSR